MAGDGVRVRNDGLAQSPLSLLVKKLGGALWSTPELDLLEIPYSAREYSLCSCCGSDGMSLGRPASEHLSDIRVQRTAANGADILAVACPYRLQMFEDSATTMDFSLQIRNVAELPADAL